MLLGQYHLPDTLTRDDWVKVLSQHRRREWPSPHPRERRGRKREQISAFATLIFQSSGSSKGPEEQTVYQRCPVRDASSGGLSLRVQQKIATGTVLHVDLSLGDKRYGLWGKVVHTHGFPGNLHVGVELTFPATGDEK